MTLSGGQKARVALARALFANRQIYLLDNALSSVDRNVGDRIFQHAIKEMLGNKTVVMVTTDIQVGTNISPTRLNFITVDTFYRSTIRFV